ncbi:hypothetical protein C8J57DRAFT_74940 [Mycena rebaudengoi]|nr:hypothetical protein C8J57DRAFT_74940 [Mycena rebaudengoi]
MPSYTPESDGESELSGSERTAPTTTSSSASPPRKGKNQTRKNQREMQLRADPLTEVLGPALVRCLGCGGAIKLSLKSEYDTSHWLRHRARCVKKAAAREAMLKRAPADVPLPELASSSSPSSPPSSERAPTPHEDEEDDVHITVREPTITYPVRDNLPVLDDWRSWDWSQLKSRFLPDL